MKYFFGRNMQFIPYGLAEQDKYLDASNGFVRQNQHHPGLDAKFVLHDAFTLDLTANPDFSEIGSDDPKVQVNQRFEVIFPERRPFFLENASIFSMPEMLFFSRRIVDPQFGAKMTGAMGRWSLGALASDDRAPGEVLAQGVTGHGDRAAAAVFRGEREFGHQSHVGLFLSDTSFDKSMNRVASLDLRYLMAQNWSLTGQATTTQARDGSGNYTAGPGYILGVAKVDPHVAFSSNYMDRSPGMQATLGYLNRVDMRNWETYYGYQWKPTSGHTVLSYGPSIDASVNYDHEQRLENWSVTPGFSINLSRLSYLSVSHNQAYELYSGTGFRERLSSLTLGTSWTKWLQMNASYSQGQQPNYYPASGERPFLGSYNYASGLLTLRPQPRLRLDEIYYYTRLATGPQGPPAQSNAALPAGDVFTNHLIRSKVNYQFTRNYAFNAIFDYNANLPNQALVSSSYSKQADTTLLFTYLPHPGTAVYVGYADTFQNLDFNPAATSRYTVTSLPGTSTDKQLFAKISYLFRF